jgi:hypothetical protein
VSPREEFRLSPQQVAYFNTFGFLHLPRLFSGDINKITDAFERVFADPGHERYEMRELIHGENLRVTITGFIENDPVLSELGSDPRVRAIVEGLIGRSYEFTGSDGTLWFCETHWHSDSFAFPMAGNRIKLSFYLDSLRGDNGALRLIPGSNYYDEGFAEMLRKNLPSREDLEKNRQMRDVYGVDACEIPASIVENEPGDVIVWNQRTMHASFNGWNKRRSFALTFKEGNSERNPVDN